MVISGTGMSVSKNAWTFAGIDALQELRKIPFFWYVMFIVSVIYNIYKKEPDAFGDTHSSYR